MGGEAELVKLRFARGVRCFAVMVAGDIAGYGWLSMSPEWIGEVELEIRPRKAEAYIWNCVTLPEHRRKGVFRSLVVGIAEAARQIGVRRVWIGSVDIPAEKALAPLGFRPAAHFRTFRFLGVFVTTGTKIIDSEARRVISYSTGVTFGAVDRRRH
jgi:GNAT superfamily N-acetyltransferase